MAVLGGVTAAVLSMVLGSPAPAGSVTLSPILVSSGSGFDGSCRAYRQGNDAEVSPDVAADFCGCIATGIQSQGLGDDVLEFLGRTYSEDLTAFIDEYPSGRDWMEAYFAAEQQCKSADYGSNGTQEEPNPPPAPIPAGSWGGIVRDGPGRDHRRIATLREGERVLLIENTSVYVDGYPWWVIEFGGGRQGYQWGGILCALDEPTQDLHQVCD